jgi:hypothetical protein
MRIDVERFLTITALLAAGATVAAGCGSEEVENNPKNDGGISGASGRGGTSGSAGRGGSAGTAGSSGRGGTAGDDGSAGTSGTGGTGTGGTAGTGGSSGDAATCLGDDPTDGGDPACETLPYGLATCGDAGNDLPAGLELCGYFKTSARSEVFAALFDCLKTITPDGGDPCTTAHGDAAQECLDQTMPHACTTGTTDLGGDAGTITCADISSDCAASGAGEQLSEAECHVGLDSFTQDGRKAIIQCWIRNTKGKCNETFDTCLFDPSYVEP